MNSTPLQKDNALPTPTLHAIFRQAINDGREYVQEYMKEFGVPPIGYRHPRWAETLPLQHPERAKRYAVFNTTVLSKFLREPWQVAGVSRGIWDITVPFPQSTSWGFRNLGRYLGWPKLEESQELHDKISSYISAIKAPSIWDHLDTPGPITTYEEWNHHFHILTLIEQKLRSLDL